MKNNTQISASEFKKDFLALIDEIKSKHPSFTITEKGTPVVRVIPVENNTTQESKSFFGFMKGTAKIKGDIVNYSSELDWDACNV